MIKPRRLGPAGSWSSWLFLWGLVLLVNRVIFRAIVFLVIIMLWGLAAPARERIVERDTKGDSQIDQIARFGEDGQIRLLEIDRNGDGRMDIFQYYDREQIVRLERDVDHAGQIDQREYFENGRRKRLERLSPGFDGRYLGLGK